MSTFMGIDLAWSPKNNTGIAILQDNKIIYVGIVQTLDEIRERIMHYTPSTIGIDAPLTIPNETGNREAEKELNKIFRTHDAGCYPANRTLLGKYNKGVPRGEELKHIAEKLGYAENDKKKAVIEVYPHAAQIRLFNRDKILKYKKDPALLDEYEALLKTKVEFTITETARKKREDMLDAIMCAIVAKYYQEGKYELFGNHIVVPKLHHKP